MPDHSYHQFCPVAMAAEILCTRWTMLLLRELLCGSTRFNELRRGLPRMSPALLSQRLKELEEAGIVERRPVENEPWIDEYHLTESGQELRPLIVGMGTWGHRWVKKDVSLEHLDAEMLMSDIRRNLRVETLPSRRVVIHFHYPEAAPKARKWWMIVNPEEPIDVCTLDPGFDVDLFINADLRAMTAVWMGLEEMAAAREDGRILLTGDERLADSVEEWIGESIFAKVERKVA
jgi:DNA-binding HxlR family transcriptional regulator